MRLLLVIITLLSPIALANADESQLADASNQEPLTDIVISGFDQPLRARLIVSIDGASWRQHFEAMQARHLRSLFHQLDANDDGRLTSDEAKRLPSPELLGGPRQESDVFIAFNFRVLDADGDGGATIDELARYVASFGDAPLRMFKVEGRTTGRGCELFNLLDEDGDGRLVKREWLDVSKLFARDRDGNRVLTKEELQTPSANIFGPEFVAVPLARGLSSKPLIMKLAAAEQTPADILIVVRFSDSQASADVSKRSSVEVTTTEDAQKLGLRSHSSNDDAVVLQDGRRRIELRLLPSVFRRDVQLRQAILREYEAAAERTGGRVNKRNLPPLLGSFFPIADSNADGILGRDELNQWIDGYVEANLGVEASRLRLLAFDERGGLATLVDRNLDGRLGQRELGFLAQELAASAKTSDGFTRDDLPTTVSLILQRGPFDRAAGPDLLLNAGPPWFFRADRNQDGDLDQSEFFGSPELFHQLDTNGDGWIDLQEAVQADQMFSSN